MADEELDQEFEEEEDNERWSIRKEKRELLKEMRKYDRKSDEYMILSARLTEITECERNLTGALLPAFIQGGMSLLGTTISNILHDRSVKKVIDYEDRGNILNTKATQFLRKPKD